jgi:hypothetical protein
MSFEDLIKSDLQNAVLNTDELAEEITYVTKSGVQSTINAIVERDLLESAGGGADTRHKYIDIVIANDADAGVTSVDLTGDYVLVPEYAGHPAIRYRIVRILDVDAAGWALRCVH